MYLCSITVSSIEFSWHSVFVEWANEQDKYFLLLAFEWLVWVRTFFLLISEIKCQGVGYAEKNSQFLHACQRRGVKHCAHSYIVVITIASWLVGAALYKIEKKKGIKVSPSLLLCTERTITHSLLKFQIATGMAKITVTIIIVNVKSRQTGSRSA